MARRVTDPADPRGRWRALVPVVCLVAGVGFAASAGDSGGEDLRPPGIISLADTVHRAEDRVRALDDRVGELQAEVSRLTRDAGSGDSAVARQQKRVAPLLVPGGLRAVEGAGLVVVLDDADDTGTDGGGTGDDPAGGSPGAGASADANTKVVHQSDLQAVVNALWAGGAEAMTIAGQRVIPTSAVRCVGNTLLLNGEVYSPPYRVAAIGPSRTMLDRLEASPGVKLFRDVASYYGLGYTTETVDSLTVPAYTGSISLEYAQAGR